MEGTRRRLLYGKLPRDIETKLSKVHIEIVWDLLADMFSFNAKLWKKHFYQYFQKEPHEVTEQEAFVEFGAEFINPLLNMILKRDENHPTWSNILKYVVRK